MMKSLLKKIYLFSSVLFLSVTFFSCAPKNIKYFQDIPDSGQLKQISKVEYLEPTIQVDDILTILVQTVDPQSTNMINMANVPVLNSATVVSNSINVNQQTAAGLLVDKAGDIEIPILGKIHALGLTTTQLRDVILKEALVDLKSPTVTVRFANFKISITGEVARPGQYIVPSEKVNLLDAIAMAGDLTIYGKRDNVLLIRENQDGTKTPYRINLNRSNTLSASTYYLRQNDIIYVEPGKAKAAATDVNQARTFSIIGAALSVLIVFLSRVKY